MTQKLETITFSTSFNLYKKIVKLLQKLIKMVEKKQFT